MARKLRIQYEDALYHVINRGNYRRDVFGPVGAAQGPALAPGRRRLCVDHGGFAHGQGEFSQSVSMSNQAIASSGLTPYGFRSATNIRDGVVRVNLDGSASNPLVPGSPPIAYDTSLSIDFNTGNMVGSITRTDFPSVQIFVDGENIYNHVEVGTPTSLYDKTTDVIKKKGCE